MLFVLLALAGRHVVEEGARLLGGERFVPPGRKVRKDGPLQIAAQQFTRGGQIKWDSPGGTDRNGQSWPKTPAKGWGFAAYRVNLKDPLGEIKTDNGNILMHGKAP